MLNYCDIIAQSDPTTRVRQSRTALPTPSRCLQGPPASRRALKIHVLSFHLESRHLVRFPSTRRPRWNPKRPPGWASCSAPKRTEDSGAFLQAQRHFCLGEVEEEGSEGEVASHFLHCGSGQFDFIQQAPRPPRTTLSQPPPAQ